MSAIPITASGDVHIWRAFGPDAALIVKPFTVDQLARAVPDGEDRRALLRA